MPVHLIEATAPESRAHPGFDGRAIALAAGTCQQLARISIWQSLADCATAITTVHVSNSGHAGFVTLAARRLPTGGAGTGYKNCTMFGNGYCALLRRSAAGVTLHCLIAWLTLPYSTVEVTLESGEALSGPRAGSR
ncbi:hypothetical protein ACLK1S_17950 [Escherichia coli]